MQTNAKLSFNKSIVYHKKIEYKMGKVLKNRFVIKLFKFYFNGRKTHRPTANVLLYK